MPEGDSLRRAGRRLEPVEAVGKNLLLGFKGGLVLRSHLGMRGRWEVRERGSRPLSGTPWLVPGTATHEAVLRNGPVLELGRRAVRRLGPDILDQPPDLARMVDNLRREHPGREVGDALLDQRLVAGIGNLWRAEALWGARIPPWRQLGDLSDVELEGVLAEAARLMRASVEGAHTGRRPVQGGGAAAAVLVPPRPAARCIAGPAAPVRAAARRSARAGRATTTARPTGVRAAREERSHAGRKRLRQEGPIFHMPESALDGCTGRAAAAFMVGAAESAP
jgi:endonuclease-8